MMISIYKFCLIVCTTITVYGVIIQGSHLKRSIIYESILTQIYANTTYNVSKESEQYSRITEPNVKLNSTLRFKLEENGHLNVFGITEKSGIVYIKDAGLLKNLTQPQVTLKIYYGNDQSTEIVLELQTSLPKICNNNKHCSDKFTKSTCLSSCGVGTKSYCQWRQSPDEKYYHKNYSTCISDITTCPDGNCDELEAMYPLICPQDCTTKVSGPGSPRETRNKLGNLYAKGVCRCFENVHCMCANPKIWESKALPSTTLPSTTLPSTTLPSTALPSTTLTSTTLISTTLTSSTLPSTTLPSTTLPNTALPSTTLTSTTLTSTTLTSSTLPSTMLPSTMIVIVIVTVGIAMNYLELS